MDLFSHLFAVALFFSSLILLYNLYRPIPKRDKAPVLPPEPPGSWPLLGHLPLLGGSNPLARTLGALADVHGPIFSIRLGVYQAVVVTQWEAVKECFTTNDRALANRPESATSKYLGYNGAGFGFAPYGPYWREMRKLAVLEMLSARRLEMLRHMRESEVSTALKELYHRSAAGKVVISEWLEWLTLNIIARMIAGRRYSSDGGKEVEEESRRFRKVTKEFMYVSGDFGLSDLMPFAPLRWVDMLWKLRKVKRIMGELEAIVGSWIEEHVEKEVKSTDRGNEEEDEGKDFIDVMLAAIDEHIISFGHTRDTIIKATIMNLILAGSDTTSINLTWILSALVNHKHELKRAQEEIDAKVGKTRWVEEADIKNLVYLQAIVKETLRLYPPGPLAVPHLSSEDCRVGDYLIPKGTRLLVNVWKLHRDPRVWSDPDKFLPERFLTGHGAELDLSGHQFEFTPFGSGRRACPGITFALQVSHLALARLLQGFDLRTPLDEPVDMSEGLGITLPKAKPLEVLVTPRLASRLYEI